MAAADSEVIIVTSESPHLRPIRRLRELYAYREVLANIVRKELKVKYTSSVLGAAWSVLNPIVFLAVFSFVVIVTGNQVPHFPVYLLSGLLAWNLFSGSLVSGVRSVVDNSNLVKKMYFPREILPLASIGVALVDFVLQTAVLLLFMLVTRYPFHLAALVIYPLSFLTLVVFTSAAVFWVAAVNVRYRDVQHLLNLGLLVWFWFTPIVYSGFLVYNYFREQGLPWLWNLYLLNPLTPIVLGFQRALYGVVRPDPKLDPVLPTVSGVWLVGVLGITLLVSLVLLSLTWRLFFRLSGDFAEEL